MATKKHNGHKRKQKAEEEKPHNNADKNTIQTEDRLI